MGFTLEEIRSLLKLRSHVACHATRALAKARLNLIDANIRELRQLRKELARLVAACDPMLTTRIVRSSSNSRTEPSAMSPNFDR